MRQPEGLSIPGRSILHAASLTVPLNTVLTSAHLRKPASAGTFSEQPHPGLSSASPLFRASAPRSAFAENIPIHKRSFARAKVCHHTAVKKKKKNSAIWYALINFLIGILLGLSYIFLLPDSFWEASGIFAPCLFALMMLFSIYFHIFIHEAGHGLFGRLCGFRFVSFRIGSVILMKTETGLRFSNKGAVSGIGGQCLMCPPDGRGLSYRSMPYHLGGVIMNTLFGTAAFLGYLFLTDHIYLRALCLFLFTFGLFFVLMNGIPMLAGGTPNDGFNAFHLRKNPEMRRSFDIQLRIVCAMTEGKRLRELPLSWFDLPPRDALSNPQVAALLFFRGDYFMDRLELDAAHDIFSFAASLDTALPMHIAGACAELLFIDLLTGQYSPERFRTYTANLPASFSILSYLRSTVKRNPASARVLYTYEALFERNMQSAMEYWRFFDMHCHHPQFTGNMESEKDLMALAQAAAARLDPANIPRQ